MSSQGRTQRCAEITAIVHRLMDSRGLTFGEAWNQAAHDPQTANLFNAMEQAPGSRGKTIVPARFSSIEEWNALNGVQPCAGRPAAASDNFIS